MASYIDIGFKWPHINDSLMWYLDYLNKKFFNELFIDYQSYYFTPKFIYKHVIIIDVNSNATIYNYIYKFVDYFKDINTLGILYSFFYHRLEFTN